MRCREKPKVQPRPGGRVAGRAGARWPRSPRPPLLAVPALSGVPARLVKGCADWIISAGMLELLSAVGFVVFFKLVFAAPLSWRQTIPAALRGLGASTILPAGGLIGPSVGAWSGSSERPTLKQLTRSTITFVMLTNAPAAIAVGTLGTLLWLGLPGGPHGPVLTLLPATLAAAVLGATWLVARSTSRHPAPVRSKLGRALTKPARAVGDGISDAQTLVHSRNWKLTGAIAYSAFDAAVLWAAFHAYGHTPPIGVIAMGYLIGSLAGALPLPAGVGAVDGGLIGALVLYGAPIAPAAAAVFLYRGISLALPASLGALGWMCSPTGRSHPVGGRSAPRFGKARLARPTSAGLATAPCRVMSRTILLTGATGYIGGRLLRRLEREDLTVRCLTRRPEAVERIAALSSEVVVGDVLDRESLTAAMASVEIACYLVHSMNAKGGFEDLDRQAAANFADAARAAGVRHIVYLSGLGSGVELSPHLASRHEVGHLLRHSGVCTTELRASIVIGEGSASFETVRTVVERFPAIPAPKWVDTAAQPIAIDDVLEYLVAAISAEPGRSSIYEIGGSDKVTYAEVMREYARQRKLPPAGVRSSRGDRARLAPAARLPGPRPWPRRWCDG